MRWRLWGADFGDGNLHDDLCAVWIDFAGQSRRSVDHIAAAVRVHGLLRRVLLGSHLQALQRQAVEAEHRAHGDPLSGHHGHYFPGYQQLCCLLRIIYCGHKNKNVLYMNELKANRCRLRSLLCWRWLCCGLACPPLLCSWVPTSASRGRPSPLPSEPIKSRGTYPTRFDRFEELVVTYSLREWMTAYSLQVWYTHPAFSIALGGILPFGAVCIELFFIMSAMWLHQVRACICGLNDGIVY